jgi:hypothetical protein
LDISKKVYIFTHMNRTLEQIQEDIKKAQEAYDVKFHDMTPRSWEEFMEWAKPEILALDELSREKRMMMPYELSDIPDYADIMSLEDFIGCVNDGEFIDYDGYGHYVLNGKETNVVIYPSDIKHQAIRREFDSVAWYNR